MFDSTMQVQHMRSYTFCTKIKAQTIMHANASTHADANTCIQLNTHKITDMHQAALQHELCNHKSNQPPVGSCSAATIFLPSSCILGKPFAVMAMSQYTLNVSTVACLCKCSNRVYFASSSFALSMAVLTSAEITPLCFSFNRLSFGLTTSRNSSSYASRNCGTENGEAAGNGKVKVNILNDTHCK